MNDVFDRILKHTGPRYIYGTGDGADKLILYLKSIGVFPDGICVSDDFYREKTFHGIKTQPIGKLAEISNNGLFMMAFGTKSTDDIFLLKEKINLIYPEMPVVGDIPFTLEQCKKDKEKIEKAYSLLADDISKNVFESIINFRLSGDISFLKNCETSTEEGYELIIKNKGEEILFDCGAYIGDTADDFNFHSLGLKKLYAAEPCPKSFEKLKAKYGNCNLYNCAIGAKDGTDLFVFSRGRGSVLLGDKNIATGKIKEVKVKTVDGILSGDECTIIKYDVEGAESDALLGSRFTINKYHPSLLIASYHKYDDIYTIPLLLDSICSGYRIYMRHHPCLPSWETNIYAVWEDNSCL